MSFFKKAMANTLGIGGTKVDTQLHSPNVVPGGKVEGTIKIYGGSIEQHISKVTIIVKTSYEKESNDKKLKMNINIQTFEVTIGRMINPKEVIAAPFAFILDPNTPLSTYKYKVCLSTSLDIVNAIDSGDGDNLNVTANQQMQNVLSALNQIGFTSREVENVHSRKMITKFPFIQEFEFVAHSGIYRGKLDELELVFSKDEYGLGLYLQIDRKVRGIGSFLSEKLSLDESNVKLYLSNAELGNIENIKNSLINLINQYL